MRILLVEDERLTREGILKSIAWHSLGITEVREAVDGLDALEIAAGYEPDIIVTDVRMPRMDGVESAAQLRRLYPHAKIIFLSGYADKDYLKAAISLQAVSYVEKPIDIEEVEEAVRQAVALRLEDRHWAEQDAAAKQTLQLSSAYIQQEVALELLRKGNDMTTVRQRLALSGLFVPTPEYAVSIVMKYTEAPEANERLHTELEMAATSRGLHLLMAHKDEVHTVVHFISEDPASLSIPAIRSLCMQIVNRLQSRGATICLAAGQAVDGLLLLSESYMTAVMLLQECFYKGAYSIVVYEPGAASPGYSSDPQLPKRLRQLLEEGNPADAQRLIADLAQKLQHSPGTLVATVKELFFRIWLEMEQFAVHRQLKLFPAGSTDHMLWDQIQQCQYLHEVKELVCGTLGKLKDVLNERSGGSTAAKIMTQIHLHYADPDLSVSAISEEMQMTSSHLISIFKETTGTTVKQYLMEYRAEKAKELLIDQPKLKVADIAARVGYRDGENFAKMFRRFAGMTPSEYRERFAP